METQIKKAFILKNRDAFSIKRGRIYYSSFETAPIPLIFDI